MEYKLSSFQFCEEVNRKQKHYVIKKINSIRSKCPSDAQFTGQFHFDSPMFSGEIKILFSKGSFFASNKGSSIENLMDILINELEDQVTAWKDVRFDQPGTFIDYSQPIPSDKKAASS